MFARRKQRLLAISVALPNAVVALGCSSSSSTFPDAGTLVHTSSDGDSAPIGTRDATPPDQTSPDSGPRDSAPSQSTGVDSAVTDATGTDTSAVAESSEGTTPTLSVPGFDAAPPGVDGSVDASTPPPKGECTEIVADTEWIQHSLRNYWRDDLGMHWIASRANEQDRLTFDTHDPETGVLTRRVTYPVFDDYPAGVTEGVAHSDSGIVVVAFTVAVDFIPHHYLLFTSSSDPETYELRPLNWNVQLAFAGRAVAWDGEAFVVHGLVNDENDERMLAVARFDEQGNELLPLTVVGAPSTTLASDYDVVTDSVSGTTWMAAPGPNAARATGTLRDGTPLTADGQPRLLADTGTAAPAGDAHVSLGQPGEAMFTFQVALEGFRAQLADSALDPIGEPITLVNERDDVADFRYQLNAGAYWEKSWWLFTQNGLGVKAHRVAEGEIVESVETVHYPARELREETGEYPFLMLLDHLSTYVYGDELWLAIDDASAREFDGPQRFRLLRFKAGCVYPSLYDRLLAGELP